MSEGAGFFRELLEFARIGILVNPIDGRNGSVLRLVGDGLIGGEHELFDELMALVVFAALDPDGTTPLIEDDADLSELEVEGSVGKTFSPQHPAEPPGTLQVLDETTLFLLGNRSDPGGVELHPGKGLLVAVAAVTPDHGRDKAGRLLFSRRVEFEDRRMGEPFDARLQRTDAVAELLRQHGKDAVGEIDAVAALAGLAVEGGPRLHVMGDIGDMHGELPTAVGTLGDADRVVEVLRVLGIDREDLALAPILAAGDLGLVDGLGDGLRLAQDGFGKGRRETVAMNDGKDIDAGIVLPSEHLAHLRGGEAVGAVPSGEIGHDDVTLFGLWEKLEKAERSREPTVLGHNRGAGALAVKSTNDAGARALDDTHDFGVRLGIGRESRLAPRDRSGGAAGWSPAMVHRRFLPARRLGRDQMNLDLVAIEGGAGEASGNEDFRLLPGCKSGDDRSLLRQKEGALALPVAGELDCPDERWNLRAHRLGDETVTRLATAFDFAGIL